MDSKNEPKNGKKKLQHREHVEDLEFEVLEEGSLAQTVSTTPRPGPSRASIPPLRASGQVLRGATPPLPTTPPNQRIAQRKRRWQEANLTYNEEVMDTLRLVGSATMELINQLKAPDELESVRNIMQVWSPDRRNRVMIKIGKLVNDEEETRFEQQYG